VTSLPENIIPESPAMLPGGKKRCASCGFETEEDYQFCPKCGREL